MVNLEEANNVCSRLLTAINDGTITDGKVHLSVILFYSYGVGWFGELILRDWRAGNTDEVIEHLTDVLPS